MVMQSLNGESFSYVQSLEDGHVGGQCVLTYNKKETETHTLRIMATFSSVCQSCFEYA